MALLRVKISSSLRPDALAARLRSPIHCPFSKVAIIGYKKACQFVFSIKNKGDILFVFAKTRFWRRHLDAKPILRNLSLALTRNTCAHILC